ncbi:MAG: SDR family NAD(P)-dependent oxidoreductase [Sphaerochaetaceae bacterium]|jgi:meso-butanediol dehydrogenase/(S,S)-butanediol dehydrogenase/diacetyl reductase
MKYEEFSGKLVMITGVCGGIGSRIVEDFLANGSTVFGTDVNKDVLNELSEKWNRNTNGKFIPMLMDVTRWDDVETSVSSIEKEYGCLDLLINCAGVSQMIYTVDLTESDWDFVMDVNAKGVFICSKFVAQQMIKHNKQGKIVSIASLAGKVGAMWQAHYNASKFAVVGFTQGFALELAPHKINVNCVCPAFVKTDMQAREVQWEAKLRGWEPQAVIDNYVNMTPLGRLETPEDVSKVVLFLSSSGADFITGNAINVTGGVYMG